MNKSQWNRVYDKFVQQPLRIGQRKQHDVVAYLHPTKGWKKRAFIASNRAISVIGDDLIERSVK